MEIFSVGQSPFDSLSQNESETWTQTALTVHHACAYEVVISAEWMDCGTIQKGCVFCGAFWGIVSEIGLKMSRIWHDHYDGRKSFAYPLAQFRGEWVMASGWGCSGEASI